VTLLALCACTPDAKWEDLTGKGRSDAQRKADYAACYEKSGFRPDSPSSITETEALDECLAEHGWRSESEGWYGGHWCRGGRGDGGGHGCGDGR
jgi:hypothetical protein